MCMEQLDVNAAPDCARDSVCHNGIEKPLALNAMLVS